MKKLLLIDGNSIANRAYYALPYLSNHEGRASGAVFGFANIILKVLLEQKPSHVIVAFDHARKTFRNELYSEYKMQRKPSPQELIDQFPIIKEMLSKMNIAYFEIDGIEADDIIGTLSKNFDGDKFILSGDRDLLQLIDKNTTVWLTKKGVSEVDKVDENRLKELYGLAPYQIIELKGLMGDVSDNIPGVNGIGEKTALSLLEKFDNIENIYENIDKISGKLKDKLINDKEMAFISKQLATIKRDCEINCNYEDCKFSLPFDNELLNFFIHWDFSSLTKNKELFNDINPNVVNKSLKTEKLTLDLLKQLVKNQKDYFCYDLKNLQFIFGNIIYYIDKNISLFENPLDLKDVFQELKPIFENPSILKITKNVKDDLYILSNYDIDLTNYFDLTVADYLVSAGLKSKLENISLQDYFKEKNLLEEKILSCGLNFIYNQIEMPLTKLLFDMEKRGFKINEEKLDEIRVEFEQKISTLKEEIYIQAGEEFNINSPKQVSHILFEKLGIQAYNNKKQSTRANILDELRYIPIVDNILTFRKYSKLLNTYVNIYQEICRKSGDIIHTTFNQTLTSTGRLSSSEPNLQNIPTRNDEGKILRKIFISRFEGGKIISADYNQIELRLLADMSGEEKLIDSYNRDEDIHTLTASHIFNIPTNQVSPSQRRDAKAVNFGIIYGISDYGLSQNIKSSRILAKEYINSYFSRYPKVKQFMDDNVKFAQERGYAVTKYGRIRQIPEISSSKYITRTFGERVAMNMPLQGTASDIIKIAMLKVDEALKKYKLKSELILQIHDELIIDTFPGEDKDVKNILKKEMEGVCKLKVPLIVSIGEGESLYDCK